MLHPDEGTIHSWLDGQLPRDEAATLEAHVAECRSCAGAVAEARGLIAASSRILMALDGVPRDVAPKQAVPVTGPDVSPAPVPVDSAPNVVIDLPTRAAASAAKRAQRRWLSGPSLAAAAAVIIAVGSFAVLEKRSDEAFSIAPDAVPSASGPSAITPAVPPPAASPLAVRAPNAIAGARSTPPSNEAPRGVADGASSVRLRAESAPQQAAAAELGRSAKSRPASADKASERDEAKEAEVLRAKGLASVADSSSRQAFAAVTPAELRNLKKAETTTVTVFRGATATESKQRLQTGTRQPSEPVVTRSPAPPASPTVTTPAPAAPVPAPARDARADAAAPNASTGSIVGRVVDGNGTGIAQAQVLVAGTQTGATTNAQGEYRLGNVAPGQVELLTRRIGYEADRRTVAVVAGQSASADVVIKPAATTLSDVVVTGAATSQERRAFGNSVAKSDAESGAAMTAAGSNAIGCYELGITTTDTRLRDPLRQVPRRVALEQDIVPANADGVWYRARDLSRTGSIADGLWRPVGTDGVELEWTYGSRIARIRLTGPPRAMMRGTVDEIDRSSGTSQSGTVVSSRRACQ